MAVKKRLSLGRGLDKLLSAPPHPIAEENFSASVLEIANESELRYLPIEQIQPGLYQPRKEMDLDALEELSNSIRSQGILQPVVVRPLENHCYELIAGERRWRAAQMAELQKIPAIVKIVTDEDTFAMALIENIQRENLNPMEEAFAISRLIEEFSMTHQKVAQVLGKSRASVSNLLRLMTLTREVKDFLSRGDLELGHAKVLLALEGAEQIHAAKMVIAKGLSVRETETFLKKLRSSALQFYSATRTIDPDIRQLQLKLTEKLGSAVKIQHNNKGKGKLVISYNNLEELDEILIHINK